jgi:hypothetical protein
MDTSLWILKAVLSIIAHIVNNLCPWIRHSSTDSVEYCVISKEEYATTWVNLKNCTWWKKPDTSCCSWCGPLIWQFCRKENCSDRSKSALPRGWRWEPQFTADRNEGLHGDGRILKLDHGISEQKLAELWA